MFILLLLLLVGAGTLFASRLKSVDVELEAQRKTALALAEAKQALLGRAILDDGGGTVNPGRFPCPDQDNDGDAEGAVCSNPYIGRVPRLTLRINDVRDGAGERLWYVVDGNFRSSNSPINTTILPSLTLNGVPVVAIIFAPGGALSALAQNRTPGGTPNPSLAYANYLESFSETPTPHVATALVSPAFNDRVIGITPEEIFTPVTLRVVRELAQANGAPPYAASNFSGLTLPGSWSDNSWLAAVDGASSSVSSTVIVIKFANCAIVYKITGPNAVSFWPRSC